MQLQEQRTALDRWEIDGGSIPEPSGDAGGREDARCTPSLPAGYDAQPVWGFRDRSGLFSYEFNRVYGPPSPSHLDSRGPTSRLEEDLSYWNVNWMTVSSAGDERAAGRWVTFARARSVLGSRMTFERFCSLAEMRSVLPELLRHGNPTVEVGVRP